MMMENNRVGHCQSGNSDKVYIVTVSDNDGDYIVNAIWGRRGKLSNNQIKGAFNTIREARMEMERVFETKVKKGYQNIESSDYSGPVTLASVAEHLAPEHDELEPSDAPDLDSLEPSPAPKPKVDAIFDEEDLEAICMDNIGVEENFLVGVAYLAEEHDDSEMIYVFDRFGEKKECYKERFKIVK
jgi:predicted DNA-binding WGR domain protein